MIKQVKAATVKHDEAKASQEQEHPNITVMQTHRNIIVMCLLVLFAVDLLFLEL